MAYAVTYMRSILGSIPFLVKLYTYFLCRDLFLAPPAPVYFTFHADDPFLCASEGFYDTLIY